ncbi:MAG: glycoside hydrolase family 3 protein, partial [Lachnospiraceae bacterium]|nr:glycoside hydrolase family 3 protein [Lachnospiraceae bacterium]
MTRNYEAEIDAIIQELTLEEKVNMLHGFEFFRSGGVEAKGIPCLVSSDGPMGVRNQFAGTNWVPLNISDDFVSYMPSNSALSATWNIGCAYASGQVLGEEARGRGKDVILAPGINIKRDPLCGRNFEYMSEDPCLVEEIAVPLIEGIQESDVAACVKHFAVNNQETNRLWVDTIVDERTLREIYLPGFKAAVQKANSYSLMNAYNMFEGVHCSANKRLLNDILRGEWGYDGTVISDWGSVHSTKETAEASMDLEMSVTTNFDEYFFARPLVEAVNKGEVKMEDVDAKVKNILRMMYRLKMIGPDALERKAGAYNTREHQMAIRDVARESMVLLKNEEELLPITEDRITMEAGTLAPKKKRIAVIGRNAEILHANGGGSAEIKALYEISPLMGIKTYLGGNADVVYAPGYFIPGKKDVNEANWQETSLERQISRVDFMGETEEQQRQRVEVMAARKKL